MTNNAAAVLAWSLTLSGSEGTKAAEEGAVVGAAQAENNWAVQQGGGQSPSAHGWFGQGRNSEKFHHITGNREMRTEWFVRTCVFTTGDLQISCTQPGDLEPNFHQFPDGQWQK